MEWFDSLPIYVQLGLALSVITLGSYLVSRFFRVSEEDYRSLLAENDEFLAAEYDIDFDQPDSLTASLAQPSLPNSDPSIAAAVHSVRSASAATHTPEPAPINGHQIVTPTTAVPPAYPQFAQPTPPTYKGPVAPPDQPFGPQAQSLSLIKNLRMADILALSQIGVGSTSLLAKANEAQVLESISTSDPHSATNVKHWIKQAQLIEDGRFDALDEYQQNL